MLVATTSTGIVKDNADSGNLDSPLTNPVSANILLLVLLILMLLLVPTLVSTHCHFFLLQTFSIGILFICLLTHSLIHDHLHCLTIVAFHIFQSHMIFDTSHALIKICPPLVNTVIKSHYSSVADQLSSHQLHLYLQCSHHPLQISHLIYNPLHLCKLVLQLLDPVQSCAFSSPVIVISTHC